MKRCSLHQWERQSAMTYVVRRKPIKPCWKQWKGLTTRHRCYKTLSTDNKRFTPKVQRMLLENYIKKKGSQITEKHTILTIFTPSSANLTYQRWQGRLKSHVLGLCLSTWLARGWITAWLACSYHPVPADSWAHYWRSHQECHVTPE